MRAERLQKLMSAAGIASRRRAEELIRDGLVTVNGKVVTELGTKADPERDHIKVDGKHLTLPTGKHYFLLNKPKGVVVTRDDPQGRPTVYQLLGTHLRKGMVPVGRLDFDSEGLLIMTNDGLLVQKLTHPSGGCKKEYEVKVSGIPTAAQIAKLSRGIRLPEGVRTAPAEIALQKTTPEKAGVGGNAWLKVVLGEGRSRQIRKMFDLVGHPVAKLRRVAIGPVRDPKLPPGVFRELSAEEVEALRKLKPAPPKETKRPATERPRRSRA